jgi:hypothetical protein
VVGRISSTAFVIGLVTSTAGCLTGLGLPSHPGGGGQAGSTPPGGMTGGGNAGGGPGGDGGAATDAGGGENGGNGGGGFGANGGFGGFGGFGGPTDGGPATDALPPPNLLIQQRWVTRQARFIDGATWFAGDFDGDGRADLATVFGDQGSASIDVWLSTGSTFAQHRWATQQGGFWDTQKWLAGDFDGDGRADLANVFGDLGQISIDVHRSTGATFTMNRWATRQGGFWDAQKWLAGDFDGDGNADLANVFNDLGVTSIDVHRSTGAAFLFQRWATGVSGFWDAQKWLAGGFVFPGSTTDLVNVFNDKGQVSVDAYTPSGFTFVFQRRTSEQGGFWDTQKWLAGDFDGDGQADLANVFDDSGMASVDVHHLGMGFTRWMTREGGFWDAQQWLAGDFDGDGVCDLANVFSDNGLVSIDLHRKTAP